MSATFRSLDVLKIFFICAVIGGVNALAFTEHKTFEEMGRAFLGGALSSLVTLFIDPKKKIEEIESFVHRFDREQGTESLTMVKKVGTEETTETSKTTGIDPGDKRNEERREDK